VVDVAAQAKYMRWETLSGFPGFVFTAPVGTFRANAFGLHDMLGNVSEWFLDRHAENYYRVSPVNDPRGPSQAALRVFRGGS